MAALTFRSRTAVAARFARRAAIACFVCAIALCGTSVHAAERTPLERSVKAAFLYKFAGYVEWPQLSPQQQGAPIVIAVAGADDIMPELEQAIAGRTINERPIAVRRIAEGDSLAGVHILFIGTQERVRIATWLRAAQMYPVLIVTEGEGSLAMGSALNFVIHDGRVRFEASPEAAEKKGLKLSSRLLGVASNLRSGGQQ
jgi:hypothetical protein